MVSVFVFFSSRRRHTSCALVTGVQTCALPICADAVAHGATGKGNDQVRFELSCYALNPDIKVIAPWREWELNSRTALIDFAEKNQITAPTDKRGASPFRTAPNLLQTSSAGKVHEDPWEENTDYVSSCTQNHAGAPEPPKSNHP